MQELIPSSKQEALYCLRRPGESIWLCPSEGYLVALRKLGVEKWIVRLVQGMYANARSRVRVGEVSANSLRLRSSPPGIRTQSFALHHCAGGLVTWVSGWCSLGGPICRWSFHNCWLPRGMCREALDMERSHGEEGVEGKCRKDKGHDLWYRPGPFAKFRLIPMCCLSYRSRQQRHLLQWLQTLGA